MHVSQSDSDMLVLVVIVAATEARKTTEIGHASDCRFGESLTFEELSLGLAFDSYQPWNGRSHGDQAGVDLAVEWVGDRLSVSTRIIGKEAYGSGCASA